jgi:hypothetical protein
MIAYETTEGSTAPQHTLTLPRGLLRLIGTLALAAAAKRTWGERAALDRGDRELAQLNARNTRPPEEAIWEQRHPLLVSGPWP